MVKEILQTFKKLPESEYFLGSQKALNIMNNVRLFFSFFSFDHHSSYPGSFSASNARMPLEASFVSNHCGL